MMEKSEGSGRDYPRQTQAMQEGRGSNGSGRVNRDGRHAVSMNDFWAVVDARGKRYDRAA